jgi:hypothetical protein
MSMTCERIQLCDKVCPWPVKGYNFVIITKLYPFTSHGHTLSQSCILSQVMDILYHKIVSSTPCGGQEANSTSVCISRYSSNYLAIVASL